MLRADFWHKLSLEELTPAEWEALCDGCGKCCLHKLEDEETGEVHQTRIACRELDIKKGGCLHYQDRFKRVPGCTQLTPAIAREASWLPPSCAYRLRAEGKPLPSWHPLVAGHDKLARQARARVRQLAISERVVEEHDWELFLVDISELDP
ncbi:YcgN family cysteine cluster protein [Balneatrix alpica]|uniref:YcgN family cysteine cluster protein n=1 Tax=Balneatrix alpica TaxID=75684 RepID=A0ABV5Z6G3_9GAMM|nr:YcgN family cysteine cluster protein [Balneatrix alpica]